MAGVVGVHCRIVRRRIREVLRDEDGQRKAVAGVLSGAEWRYLAWGDGKSSAVRLNCRQHHQLHISSNRPPHLLQSPRFLLNPLPNLQRGQLSTMPTPESASFLARKPKVPPTFDGVDYDDQHALKAAQDAIVREQWIKAMMTRLVREEMSKCYLTHGVNHLEKCGKLRGE